MMDWLLEFFGTRPVEEEGRREEIYTRDFESGAFTTLWCPQQRLQLLLLCFLESWQFVGRGHHNKLGAAPREKGYLNDSSTRLPKDHKNRWADMEVPSESFHRSSWDSRTCYARRAFNRGLTDDCWCREYKVEIPLRFVVRRAESVCY